MFVNKVSSAYNLLCLSSPPYPSLFSNQISSSDEALASSLNPQAFSWEMHYSSAVLTLAPGISSGFMAKGLSLQQDCPHIRQQPQVQEFSGLLHIWPLGCKFRVPTAHSVSLIQKDRQN